VIVFNEVSLRRHLKVLLEYYHETRTHLSLEKDTPESRQVQSPESGSVVAVPQVGGLHHSARSVIFGTRGVSAIGTNVEPREGQGTALRDPFEESSPRRF
jgi:hypothetical protein